MTPQALIFDLDGTVLDTMPLHWRSWEIMARQVGLEIGRERLYSLGGTPTRDILTLLCREQGKTIDQAAAAAAKQEIFLSILDEASVIPESFEIIQAHHGKVPMGIATGGGRHPVRLMLERFGLQGYFQAVVTFEDVTRQKPAPDIFLEAARRLGVPPALCRAYEDTDLGLRAIRDAGMEAVDIREVIAASAHRRNTGAMAASA